MPPTDTVVRVLLDSSLPQLDHIFEYSIPESLRGQIFFGQKISVPLRGNRLSEAYVVGVAQSSSYQGSLQPAEKIISLRPQFSEQVLQLAAQVASRYAGSTSDVLRLVIPKRYVRAEQEYSSIPIDDEVPSVKNKLPDDLVQQLVSVQRLAIHIPPVWTGSIPQWLQLFMTVCISNLEQGRSTIISLPDFRDIQLAEKHLTDAGLGAWLCRIDSSLSGKDRYTNHLNTLDLQPRIILGNRSAVLSPAFQLGSILIWDDGDPNFYEPLAPYPHTRDVALIRQANEEIQLLVASHSRSLEIQRLVDMGWMTELSLPIQPTPTVVLTDDNYDQEIKPERIPAVAVLGCKQALEKGPVLIQVARPGFSSALICSGCRERAVCTDCRGPLGQSSAHAVPSCRWCGKLNTSWRCQECNGVSFFAVNSGAERTSAEIGKKFPGVKIIVADGENITTEIPAEKCIVIATPGAEPRVEGGYSSIMLLDGDILRSRDAIKVEEDILRQWANVIAFAQPSATIFASGSGTALGNVLKNDSYVSWSHTQFSQRQQFGLPPALRVASISGNHSAVTEVIGTIDTNLYVKHYGPIAVSDGSARVLLFFEYRHGEQLAKLLRAAVISDATQAKRSRNNARVLRLKVRFDDPNINSL